MSDLFSRVKWNWFQLQSLMLVNFNLSLFVSVCNFVFLQLSVLMGSPGEKRLLGHTHTWPSCPLLCRGSTVPPSPLPRWPALILLQSNQAWAHMSYLMTHIFKRWNVIFFHIVINFWIVISDPLSYRWMVIVHCSLFRLHMPVCLTSAHSN